MARPCMDGTAITEAGLGLAAVGAEHFRAGGAEASLVGQQATEEAFTAAAELAAAQCNPNADPRGPEDYKRHLVGELSKRALRRAAARAQGEEA